MPSPATEPAPLSSGLPRAALAELLQGLLSEGRAVELPVSGSSMEPFLRSRDVVTLRPRESARFGDVVALLAPGPRLLVHRVVGPGLTTRGDAAGAADARLPGRELLGRVERVERGGRRLRLGLGPERLLIAALSRRGLLAPLLRRLGALGGDPLPPASGA